MRMNRESLNHVVELIRHDLVFQNKCINNQIFVKSQVHFALYRLEHEDNVSEFLYFVIMWEIFEKHLFDFIRRVVETLWRFKDVFVKWSNARTKIKESRKNHERQKRFIEVVSKMNETDVVLNIKSKNDFKEELFFKKKKNTSLICVLYVTSKSDLFTFYVNDSILNTINEFLSLKIFINIHLHIFSTNSIFWKTVFISTFYTRSLRTKHHIQEVSRCDNSIDDFREFVLISNTSLIC
jgi:hypothetical protein